ncbi:MAG: hypothetical protein J0L60_06505 [Ignavibacteria bacterium]|nr:hypothetical protein [Ignavibacteria bacterium]
MTPERFEEILKNNGFEPVEWFYRDVRILSLRHYGGALSEGLRINFVESESHIPLMELETFDSEMVEFKPEVTEAIAYCIINFNAVWNYFYQKGTTK